MNIREATKFDNKRTITFYEEKNSLYYYKR